MLLVRIFDRDAEARLVDGCQSRPREGDLLRITLSRLDRDFRSPLIIRWHDDLRSAFCKLAQIDAGITAAEENKDFVISVIPDGEFHRDDIGIGIPAFGEAGNEYRGRQSVG